MTGRYRFSGFRDPACRWAACFAALALALGLVFLPVAGAPARAAMLGVALALGGLAVGVPGAARLIGLFASGAALGLILPGGLARAIVACALLVLMAALAVIWWNCPFTRERIAPGLAYRAGGAERRVPQLRIRGAAPLLLRQRVLDTLVELADYADRLLTRHGIRYAAGCGTLLGAVRHGGLIPWDDDVDFFLYEGVDRRRMEELFERLADEAERDGYRLFRHGSYWKLAPRGFWRYPVLDIYHTDWTHTQTAALLRVPWETGTICVPADAEDRAIRQYGPDALHEAVHDIPFWDSGFVPSFVTRLFGYGAIDRGSRLFERLFAVTSK